MDIFSHGLLAGALFKFLNIKYKKKFNFWRAAFWGIFPDLFAFTIPFIAMFYFAVFQGIDFSKMPHPSTLEPAMPSQVAFMFNLSSSLYNVSHSLIIFLLIFGIAYLIFKKPLWILGGWLLHIVVDIPTHSYQFYPTPILWPLSSYKFNGFAWANEWLLIADVVLLAAVYFFLFRKRKH
jgi:membrane-bound metal-dependent hydrolase YbcI (DUF457 family)